MKTKKIVLKKVTVANLNSDLLEKVKGGLSLGCGTHLCTDPRICEPESGMDCA